MINNKRLNKGRLDPFVRPQSIKMMRWKVVLHIMLWIFAGLWLLLSPIWHYRFVVREGKPLEILEQQPEETGGIRQNIEDLKFWFDDGEVHEEGETYALWGWAFIDIEPHVTQYDFNRFVVLTDDENSYVFSTEVYPRPGVQDYFEELGLDDLTSSGFYAVISRNSLPVGKYNVGLLFKHRFDDTDYYYGQAYKFLLHSPNHIIMEPYQ
jgi:hypothetical protein